MIEEGTQLAYYFYQHTNIVLLVKAIYYYAITFCVNSAKTREAYQYADKRLNRTLLKPTIRYKLMFTEHELTFRLLFLHIKD